MSTVRDGQASQRTELLRSRNILRIVLLAVVAAAFMALSGPGSNVAIADPASPLTVTKTANPSPVASGQQLTYTITTVNTGGAKVDNVVLTDQVNGVGVIQNPPALPQLIMTSTKGNCTQGGPNGNVVTCNAGSLAGGESWTVTIRGQVTAGNGTTLNNTASVTATKSAQNFTTNGTVSVLVSGGTGSPQPDLTINKTGPTSVAKSTAMAYTLTINNIGTANATNVKVVDTVPAGLTAVMANGTSLFVCGVAAQTVTCDGGAVNAGQNATITINATSPNVNGQITNTAVVDPDNTIAEGNELNNTSATVNTNVTDTPTLPLLSILKTDGTPPPPGTWWTGAGPDPVNPGEKITYKILVTNNATGTNSRADDVVVTDGTQGLEAASITASQVVVNGVVGNGNGCVVTAPEVKCKIRSLNSGGTLTITITGMVLQSAGSTIFNTATVTGNIKNTGVSASDSEETTVRPRIDLTITKADSPDPVCARSWPSGGTPPHLANKPDNLAPAATGTVEALLAPAVCLGGLTYTFVIGNSGNGPATGVTVRDPLPPGLIFDSYENVDGGLFACSLAAGNVIECTGGSIPAASTRTLKFLLVAPPNTGTITNTVYVDHNNAIFEADETNNTFVQTTQVSTGVDLVVWKSDSNPANPPGDAPPPDLVPGTAAALNDGYDPIATRGTETYTIIVDNVGTQDVTGIRVRDTLPADTIFLSVVANDPAHPLDPTHGFTCSHDGSATGGVVECIGGHLLGTASEFYDPAGPDGAIPPLPGPVPPGDDFAIIKIRVFARSTVGTMHNEVRVDPLNEIAEVNELNNLATDDTLVVAGDNDKGAYNQMKITKTQYSPSPATVATNGVLIYRLKVENKGTDPVSSVTVKDFLPAGSRFVDVKDVTQQVLPAGTAGPESASFFCIHDGAQTGGLITCTGGDFSGSINQIPSNDAPAADKVPTERHIEIKVFAPPVPQPAPNPGYPNNAVVDPDNIVAEGNEFDNDHQINTPVAPCNDQATCTAANAVYELTVTKTLDVSMHAEPRARNGILIYNLAVKNWGSEPASNVVVKDTPPQGSRFIDAMDVTPPGGSEPQDFVCGAPDASGVITCSGGTLDGTDNKLGTVPQERTIRIRVFAPDEPGTYPNQAIVDPNGAIPEGNEFNNTSAITTQITDGGSGPYIDLQISKTQEPTSDCVIFTACVEPGELYFYHLHVTNAGEADAFNVAVRDILPPHVGYLSAVDAISGPGMFVCTFNDPNIDCTGGTIPAAGSRDIAIRVFAPEDLHQLVEPGNPMTDIKLSYANQAFIDPFNAIPEGAEKNNAASVDIFVRPKIDLSITKKGPQSATQNQTTKYEIKVKNNIVWGGGSTAFGVKVVDNLPVGLIVIGSVEAGGNFTCQTLENPVNRVVCNGDLAPGDANEVTITINVFITAESGTLDNEACVDPDHVIDEKDETNNCQHASTDVTPAPTPANLSVNKSADKGTVTAGESLTYTISVSNQGGTDAAGSIQVTDTLPTQVTKNTINPDAGWNCSASTATVVDCTRTGLAAGATSNIQVITTVNAGATGQFTNTANVSGNGQAISASVNTNAGGSAIDLGVVLLIDDPDPVGPGGIVTYTAMALNSGTAAANNVLVRTTLTPDGGISLTHVNSAASNGFACVWAPNTVDCTGNLASGESTLVTMQFQLTGSVPPDLKVTVTTTVDPANTIAESDESNNSMTTDTTVHASCSSCKDLVVGDIIDSPDPVAQGGVVIYTVGIGNAGDQQSGSFDVTLTLTAASDIDFEPGGFDTTNGGADYSATAGFDCTASGNVVTCTDSGGANDGLAPGEGLLITLRVHVKTGISNSSISLAVLADSGSSVTEFDETNNTANESTQVVP